MGALRGPGPLAAGHRTGARRGGGRGAGPHRDDDGHAVGAEHQHPGAGLLRAPGVARRRCDPRRPSWGPGPRRPGRDALHARAAGDLRRRPRVSVRGAHPDASPA
ncbi:hypothetical protein NOCARDAX2BIS_210168 [Nocardioides sp. AX2bis]|nr:hypothetical protein NOCARDAX2BIS_210168 [Nocardioides sp. AX2bis]